MPQLDMFSWFNQVITTTLVMFIFYIVLLLLFLPTTTAMFKGRTKLQMFRNLNIAVITLKTNNYITDTKENLMQVLVNNLIQVYYYYSPVTNNQLNLNIMRTCYNINSNEIEQVSTNFYLVNLLAHDMLTNKNSTKELLVDTNNCF
jgi:hypothetical protein